VLRRASAAAELLGSTETLAMRSPRSHFLRRSAAGVSHGFDVEGPCTRRAAEAGSPAGPRGSRRRNRIGSNHGRRGGLWPGDGRRAPIGSAPLATLGEGFPHYADDFQEPRVLRHALPAIDGALALKERMGVAAAEIARVRVGGYRATLEVAGIAEPRPRPRRASAPYLVATALLMAACACRFRAGAAGGRRHALADAARGGCPRPRIDAAFRRSARRASRSNRATDGAASISSHAQGRPDMPLSTRDSTQVFRARLARLAKNAQRAARAAVEAGTCRLHAARKMV